ncbi:hypothetical protein L6452_09420 [Arctium lappa]|uniref:Uncharacterized protein n=1 Tax=Arctium lappa TaxID=4217 RepID=A0ACB9DJZ4_ARCLA|nr:hypothetical protein L6452_09420 [Arctium lappa]
MRVRESQSNEAVTTTTTGEYDCHGFIGWCKLGSVCGRWSSNLAEVWSRDHLCRHLKVQFMKELLLFA